MDSLSVPIPADCSRMQSPTTGERIDELPISNVSLYIIPRSSGLRDCVSPVNSEIGTGCIAARGAEEVDDRTHQLFRISHFALWNERDPLAAKLGVVIKNLLGSVDR
jgi:hypothetical protein